MQSMIELLPAFPPTRSSQSILAPVIPQIRSTPPEGNLGCSGANPNSLYAAIESGQTIAQADLNTLQVTKTWPLGVGEEEPLVADSLV